MYKDGEELATEVVQEAGLTRARLAVEVTSADNGAEVSCEVTNPASKTPLVTSATLSVLCRYWGTVGEGGCGGHCNGDECGVCVVPLWSGGCANLL